MSRFIYKLKDEKGRDIQGFIDATDRKSAQAKLAREGLYLTFLERERRQPALFFKKISKIEIITFFRQIATMLKAGIPILKALNGLAEQAENPAFRKIVNDIKSKIGSGFKFSDAVTRHPAIFSEFSVSMIRTGETAGNLSEMLGRIADYLGREEDLNRKIKSALAYPLVVSIVTLVVTTYLVMFVVPVFQSVYRGIKVALPGPTLTLMAISRFIRNAWWTIPIIAVAVILGFRKFRNDKKGGFLIDKFKISIPLFGGLNKKVAVSRFVRSFGLMISNGIVITKALDVAEPIAANKAVSRTIDKAKIAVRKGEGIASALRSDKVFPPIVIQMMATGEESGSLDEMLAKSADFLDDEIDVAIKRLTVKIEPILTFALAIIIGFIALSIYLPIFDILRQLTR